MYCPGDGYLIEVLPCNPNVGESTTFNEKLLELDEVMDTVETQFKQSSTDPTTDPAEVLKELSQELSLSQQIVLSFLRYPSSSIIISTIISIVM